MGGGGWLYTAPSQPPKKDRDQGALWLTVAFWEAQKLLTVMLAIIWHCGNGWIKILWVLHEIFWLSAQRGGGGVQYLNYHQKSISLPKQQNLLILFSVRAGAGLLCDCVLFFQGLDMKLLVISWKAKPAWLHLLLVCLQVKETSCALAPGHAMPLLRKCLFFHYRSLFTVFQGIVLGNFQT